MQRLRCPDQPEHSSAVIRYGFYQTRWGRRRRFLCKSCGKSFGRTSGSLYYRLQHRRSMVNQVAALSIEGLNKSAIARVNRISWNTVARWLERAATFCCRFNQQRIKRVEAKELQVDEIQTFVGGKKQPAIWIFVSIEVWSRLWPSTVVGKRSYCNTLAMFRDLSTRLHYRSLPLITTDGFRFYRKVVKRIFRNACLYGQVMKKRRNNRIIEVGPPGDGSRSGDTRRFEETEHFVRGKVESHDSQMLNLLGSEQSATDDERNALWSTWRCCGVTTTSCDRTWL
jgi:transposase-like protein